MDICNSFHEKNNAHESKFLFAFISVHSKYTCMQFIIEFICQIWYNHDFQRKYQHKFSYFSFD